MNSRLSSAAAAAAAAASAAQTASSANDSICAARNRVNSMGLVYHRSSAALMANRPRQFGSNSLVDLKWWPRTAFLVLAALACVAAVAAGATPEKPRARDLGVPFDGTPGPNNAIT